MPAANQAALIVSLVIFFRHTRAPTESGDPKEWQLNADRSVQTSVVPMQDALRAFCTAEMAARDIQELYVAVTVNTDASKYPRDLK